MIKKVLLLCATVWCAMQAGIQGDNIIYDRIEIKNTTKHLVRIQNQLVKPGATGTYKPDHDNGKNYFDFYCASKKYRVNYPTYNSEKPTLEVFNTVTLDLKTMLVFANEYPDLDEVCVNNDTLYTIAAMIRLKETRSHPQSIQPQESMNKVVRNQEQATVYIEDENHKRYSVSFPCHKVGNADHAWESVELSANTIKLFNQGFAIAKA